MNKRLLVGLVAGSIFNLSGEARSTVIGFGTFDLSLPGINQNVHYGYPQNHFATTYIYNGNSLPLENRYYLNSSSYEENAIDGNNSVYGKFNPLTGDTEFKYQVNAPDPANGIRNNFFVDFVASASFYGTLDLLSYAYSFDGIKENSGDQLYFTIQMAIGYADKTVYSDYGIDRLIDPVNNYRTNWVHIGGQTPELQISEQGSRLFDYSQYGNQNWWITWDFMSSGYDSVGITPSAVPEPATMLLFGAGIAGLAAVGRRKRN